MYVVGVDGCRYGWVAVILNLDSGYEIAIFRTFGELWQALPDSVQILADIPIGLKEDDAQERRCDKEARAKLRPYGNSVFPAPRRPTIYFQAKNPDYRKVNDFQKELCGKGLSQQTCAIIPKIRQVDELLLKDQEARRKIREVHPEVCFWALNCCKPLTYRKKRAEGFGERVQLLKRVYPQADKVVAAACAKFKGKDVARDDIVDALAAAVTALLGQSQPLDNIPDRPETDALGLPMEMVYARRSKIL
jgi:predicted RNase H-like nuclease